MELPYKRLHLREFVVEKKSIESDIDTNAEWTRKSDKASNVLNRIASGTARSEARATAIDSVGTMADSLYANVRRSCGSKEFEGIHERRGERRGELT